MVFVGQILGIRDLVSLKNLKISQIYEIGKFWASFENPKKSRIFLDWDLYVGRDFPPLIADFMEEAFDFRLKRMEKGSL